MMKNEKMAAEAFSRASRFVDNRAMQQALNKITKSAPEMRIENSKKGRK